MSDGSAECEMISRLENVKIKLAGKGIRFGVGTSISLASLMVKGVPKMKTERILPKIKKHPIGKVTPTVFDDDETQNEKGCASMDSNKNNIPENEKVEEDGANMNNEKNQDNNDAAFLIQGDAEETTVESTERELLPAGDYPATIGDVWLEKVEGDKGKSYMKVTVPFDVELESGKTRRVYFSGSTNLATTKSRFRPIVEGVLGAVPKGLFDVRALEGKRVTARVGQNTFNGGTRNQVDDAKLLEN